MQQEQDDAASFNAAYAKVYGQQQQADTLPAPAPAPSAEMQSDPATGNKTLDKRQMAEKVEGQAEGKDSQEMSAGDYAWDAGVGVAHGVVGFAQSIGKLTNDLADTVGLKFADDSAFENPIHTKSWVGGLTSGLTQFALAFLPAVGVAGRIGEAVGVTSKVVQGLAAGGIADFAAFDEKQQRLSNLVQSFPALKNPITDFLASKPDDAWAEGRLKNTLEGLGMGMVMQPVLEGLKGLKGMIAAKAVNDPEAFAKAVKTSQANVADAMDKANLSATAANASQAVQTGKLSATAGRLGAESLKNGVPQDLVDKLVNHISTSEQPFDVALNEGLQTHLNFDRIITSDDVEGLHKLALNVSEQYFQKVSKGVQGLQIADDTAQELAEIFADKPKLMWAQAAADKSAIQDMGIRLVAYRIQRNAMGQALVNSADRFLANGKVADQTLDSMTTLAKSYMELHNSVQFIQKEGARIPSYGRVEADTLLNNFDPDKLGKVVQKVLQGGNGVKAQEQFARTILASGQDPKSLVTLFDGVMNKYGGRALNAAVELHTNAILSGMTTMATKFLSDTVNAVVLPAERIIGGAWRGDASAMKFGFRQYMNIMQGFLDWTHLSEGAGRISDQYGSSLGRAWQAALDEHPLLDHVSEFASGGAITAENMGLKQGSMLGSAVDFMGNIVRLPQKMLVSMDSFWKDVNFRAYVRSEGMELADQAGIKDPDAYAKFVNDHITKSFTPEGRSANDAAMNYAKSATFQNDLLPGTMGKGVQNLVNEHPAMRLVLPFIKTPVNIFRRAVQMTPGLNLLQDEFAKMAASADPATRAVAAGRTAMGGMLWTLGIGMAAAGKLTGGGPTKPEERNGLVDSGWQPYSFALKGDDGKTQYISFKKMEPFAYFLGLAADWSEAVGQLHDDDGQRVSTAMIYSLAKNLSSKAYYNGLTELVNALSQPDKQVQHFLDTFAGSWVPAAIARANSDDYMRDARGMMDAVTRRLPWLSEDMPPARNVLGEPVKVPQGYLPFGLEGSSLARQISPFAYSKQVSDPVKDELAKLQYGFQKAPRSLKGFDLSMFKNPQGQDAYDRFQQLHGEVQIGGKTMGQSLNDLISSKRYTAMPTPDRHGDESNPRVQAVQSVIAAYRGRALSQTLREMPQIGQTIKAYAAQNRPSAGTAGVLPALATR